MKITVYLASSMGNPIYRDSVEAIGWRKRDMIWFMAGVRLG